MSVKSLKAYLVLALMMCGSVGVWANITVTFSEGDLPKIERYGSATGQPNVLFDDVTVSVDTTISGCLIVPGRGTRTYYDSRTKKTEDLVDFYGCVVDNGGGTLKLTGLNRLDSETYYFKKDYNTAGATVLANDLAGTTNPLWAYTFTGWYIEDATPLATNMEHNPIHVPAQTVFQPGDVITPQILAKNGIITSGTLHLVALWGKCCFVSGNGALSNLGNNPASPCTLDSVAPQTTHIADRFCNYDAYMQVAMLVGNDTIQGAYNDSKYGITYKSMQTTDGSTFELYKKHYGDRVYDYNSNGNYRLDNIFMRYNYRQVMNTYSPYAEATARLSCNNNQYVLRLNDTERTYNHVLVANGGRFTGGMDSFNYQDNYYYIGRKVYMMYNYEYITNTVVNVFYTGGTAGAIFGLSRNDAVSFNVYCYGNLQGTSNNGEYDPAKPSIFMAYYSSTLVSNANLYINGCSRFGNIYGGGNQYNTKVRNVNLQIYNSIVDGDVYVGGAYGTVLGQAKAIIKNTTINGNVYGCASGATSQAIFYPSAFGIKCDSLHAPTGFPRFTTTPTGGHPAYTIFSVLYNHIDAYNGDYNIPKTNYGTFGYCFYLSLAQSGSVDIELENCTIGSAAKKGGRYYGNVYGGGAIAQVLGDVKIKLKDCTVYSNVYGGGDGITTPATFQVEFPVDSMQQATYIPPSSIEVWQKKRRSYQKPSQFYDDPEDYVTDQFGERRLYGRRMYQWSFDPAILAMGGFDHVNKLAYSPNGGGWGDVQGNTSVSVTGGTVYGSIYGGGNAGRVGYAGVDSITNHGTTLTVDGTTVEGDVYGGCNQANVGGSINLTVSPGTIVKGSVYSGNNTSGTIAGDVTSTISTNAGAVYGGGYGEKTLVNGNVNLTVTGSNVTGDVYAGSALGNVNAKYGTDSVLVATSGKTTNVTLTNSTITGDVYGGGLGQQADTTKTPAVPAIEAKVFGPVTVNFNSGSARNVFGCNNLNGAPQDSVLVNIAGGTVTGNVYGGGNLAPYAAPAATPNYPLVNVTGGKTGSVFGGGYGATAILTGNPQVSATGGTVTGSLYGGGNAAAVKGNPSVKVNAGKVNGNVFGGGLGNTAKVTGNTKVSVSNGSVINGDVFGGGNAANVKGGTNVKITGTTTKVDGSVFGGGNEANVSGPTYVQVGGRSLP